MPGTEYLQNIKKELQLGRRQRKMGQNLLSAFGYVRRRATAIQEINAALDDLGLVTDPPIDSEMPFTTPRIRFMLRPAEVTTPAEDPFASGGLDSGDPDDGLADADDDGELPEPAFNVSELKSANKSVEWVSPNASVRKAYTKMILNKYSQLVVADNQAPLQKDVKGMVSFQSIAKAQMKAQPAIVRDCMDTEVSFANIDTDLNTVVRSLSTYDVVLVVGRDNRLQGIVTAWDLAEEFAELVDPFKRIGEVEERLRALLRLRLGQEKVLEFLTDAGASGSGPIGTIEDLTMGDLKWVLQSPQNWCALGTPFERVDFIEAMDKVRDYRNRLMHFRDPLDPSEMALLASFCDAVREIQL